MSKIILQNVSINYPSIGVDARSFKKSVINFATGGKLCKNNLSRIVTVNALSDINIELTDGDRLGLIGANGAGKSTLLKVLAGVYHPSYGNISVDGITSALLSISVGMKPGATGYENIYLRALMYGLSKEKIKQVIKEVEDFTELGQYLAMPVRTYSSGMNIRLAFGIATTINPDILLLDEVIGAGDAYFFKKAQARMEDLINKSNILVFASHSNSQVERFCNKALWLEHGKIRAFGATKEIIKLYEKDVELA